MQTLSGTARAVLASLLSGAALAFCFSALLLTAACGLRVSSSDFAVFKLSSAADDAAPKQATPVPSEADRP